MDVENRLYAVRAAAAEAKKRMFLLPSEPIFPKQFSACVASVPSSVPATPMEPFGAEGYARSFSTTSIAISTAIQGLQLVVMLPSTTTLLPHAPWFASRPAMDAYGIASMLPRRPSGSSAYGVGSEQGERRHLLPLPQLASAAPPQLRPRPRQAPQCPLWLRPCLPTPSRSSATWPRCSLPPAAGPPSPSS